jgi:hypothetical protein
MLQGELQTGADWIILWPNNDSGITRGYTVSYRAERPSEHRELTAMSQLQPVTDRYAPSLAPCNRINISTLADSHSWRVTRRRFDLFLQRSH